MKQTPKRLLSWLLVICMVFGFLPTAHAAGVTWEKTDMNIAAEVSDRELRTDSSEKLDPDELVRVSIVLEQPSAVEAGFATMGIAANAEAVRYQAELLSTQQKMAKTISVQALQGKKLDVVWNMTLVGNIISAWVPYGALEDIAAIRGVRSVAMEAQYEPAVAERHEEIEPNTYLSSGMIGSNPLWESGYTGAGSRIAIVDTGIDAEHQSVDNGAYLYAMTKNASRKGMSLQTYLDSLEVLTAEEIGRVLPQLHASQRMPGVTAEQLYRTDKLAFGFNYVDASLNILHTKDQQGEHGSHVAGISAANRFIPTDTGSYRDAREAVLMQGVAPDAQLITMKVFGNGDPYDSDYMAAIEDAITLGCDVVNLSLGTTMPGSPHNDTYSELLEMMTHTDTVVVISAGNAYNWATASTFGYLYNDDVSFDTVGSPGSYGSAFTVASVENDGAMGFYFTVGDKKIFYDENATFGNTHFIWLDTSLDLDGTPYPYVFLDGLGYPEEYNGIDVKDQIVFVSRGTLNFAEKANNAFSRGAKGVVIYNNEPGMHGMDLTGLNYAAPVIAITQADAALIRSMSRDQGTHLTGTLVAQGQMGVGAGNSEYYTMSAFSSWGVPSSLTLKPEITAPGGNIYSLWGSNAVTGGGYNKYENMSGTSMAAPQVAGMAALLAQVYREKDMGEKTGLSARHLAQSLLMSTAEPLREADSGGNYYSLMNQGSGLARVDLAARADSYIQVKGQEDYKVKAELGDDPERTGVYEFEFTIHNMTDSQKAYALDADLFRQDVFEYMPDSGVWLQDTWTKPLSADVTFYCDSMTAAGERGSDLNGDGVTNAADADFLLEYVVGNEPALAGNGDLSGDGKINSYDAHLLLASLTGDTVTVEANGSTSVRVRMELTAEARAELDKESPNGAYVQAFVFARGVADEEGTQGTVHSIPVLAFYGNWSAPTMYDRGTLMDLVSMTSNTAPYLYQAVGPYGNTLGIDYGDGKEYYYGGNPILDDATYLPERNAFNSLDASRITEQGFTLIRGAGAARIQVLNAETGEVYFERELGELYPAYFSPAHGQWLNSIQYARLDWTGRDAAGEPLPDGTKVHISMTAVPHYYRAADGSYSYEDLGPGATMTTPLTIDNTAPEILDVDISKIEQDRVTVTALDNEYVAAVAVLNAAGTRMYTVETPNQTEHGAVISTELDMSQVYGRKFLIAVYDYAKNRTVYEVEYDMGEAVREYFTAYDSTTSSYVGIDRSGMVTKIAEVDIPVPIRAAEYVGGYVFSVTDDNSFCVASDDDLTHTERIGHLDPDRKLQMTFVNDLAYNPVDDQLYCQFYSSRNFEIVPYLGTIDLESGKVHDLGEMPVDLNTLAIDGEGNFYSAGYESNTLYTYTLDATTGTVQDLKAVGNMGYYYSNTLSSMAWDHNEDKLYWAYPNTLLQINPKTAEVTLIGYQNALLVGLYTRPEENEGRFDPTDRVSKVELNLTDTRIMKGASYHLEASVWPWNATDRTVTWTSSDPSVAAVDATGRVTGLRLGECVITAVSNLDPTKSASCKIRVFEQNRPLQAVIGDENGEIWMSEIHVAELPAYTKLSDKSLGIDIGAATMGQDGWLYAASLDKQNLSSDLYRLDPVTFEATKIGPSVDAYVDLAPAPGSPGNSLMAVFGGNVLNVDATTGDYYNWYYMFSYSVVGIAYIGTQEYKYGAFDTMVDWYFVIDRMGYVYLLGFLEQDGKFYYLEQEQLAPDGIYTKLDLEMDTSYYGSAYFDGEMLYFSTYSQSEDNVTLLAVDVTGGSKACYEMGVFEKGVWPVVGLMELGKVENHIDFILGDEQDGTNAQPVAMDETAELTSLRVTRDQAAEQKEFVPLSVGGVKEDLVYVDVTLPEAACNADLTVSFDENMLALEDVSSRAAAFAWSAENGQVRLSLADAKRISATENVARLTFRSLGAGETTVSIRTDWLSDKASSHTEQVAIEIKGEQPHVHAYSAVVTAPTCTAQGYTTYTCECGHSYIGDRTAALGHDFVNGKCKRCDAKMDAAFEDVPAGSFFFDPVQWAVDNGITAGTTPTTFDPNGKCMRAVVVTFLWKAAGSPEPKTTVNPFTDVKEGSYYYKAVLWAYENKITSGLTETTFGPTALCNRAQVVTFLYNALGKPEVNTTDCPFTDVNAKQFYYKPMLWAVENNITAGLTATTFGPTAICNRAQVVTFLYRTYNK